jgi:PKD repeat protein
VSPFQGLNHCNVLPKALPWAGMLRPFRAKKKGNFFVLHPSKIIIISIRERLVMKKKAWIGVGLALLLISSNGYGEKNVLKFVTAWSYPSTSGIDYDSDNNILFIGSKNQLIMQRSDDPININQINTIQLDANISAFFYYRHHLFISNAYNGLIVYDISDLNHPFEVMNKHMNMAGPMHTNGTYAGIITPLSLSDDDKNLSIFDVSSPQNTVEINRVKLSGLSEIVDLFIDNHMMYVIDYEEGINAYCLSDLIETTNTEVQMIGVFDRPGNPKHLNVKNKSVYISDYDAGFCVIDFNNPECPQENICKEEIEMAMDSTFIDPYIFVATYDQKLWVLSTDGSDDMSIIQQLEVQKPACKIFHDTNYVYVASSKEVYVYQLFQDHPIPQFSAKTLEGYAPLEVSYLNTSTGNIMFNEWNFGDAHTSTDKHPVHIYNEPGQYTVTLAVSNGNQWYTEMKQNYITVLQPPPVADFVSKIQSGISPLVVQFEQRSSGEITNVRWDFGDGHTSTAITPVHEYKQTGMISVRLTVYGPGGSDSMLKQNYISIKNNVMDIARWDLEAVSTMCFDRERFLGFAATPGNIHILNVKNPMNITNTNILSLDHQAENLFYEKQKLYAACGESGLKIFDVSMPESVTPIAHIPINGFANHVWVSNDHAYISTMTSGVSVVSLSQVHEPSIISTIEVTGQANVMKVINQDAIVAEGEAGIFLYKQLGPKDFIEHSFFEANGRVVQFEYNEKGLFVAAEYAGLIILDIELPSYEMIQIGSAPDNVPLLDVTVHNDYAFVACGPDGLRVYDVTQIEEPIERSFFPSKGNSTKVADFYPYIYLADGKGGLRVFVQPGQNQLILKTPETITDNEEAYGSVCLPFVFPSNVTVYLSSNYPQLLSFPESVSISKGQLCTDFSIYMKENQLESDDIILNAMADGWLDVSNTTIKKTDIYQKEYLLPLLPLEISDQDSVQSEMIIGDIGQIKHINIKFSIEHRHISDLRVYLTGPQNKIITLFSNLNITEISTEILFFELDDNAKRHISDARLPIDGKYKPVNSFSQFYGMDVKGKWKLLIVDTCRKDGGILHHWSMICDLIHFQNSPPEAFADYVETDRRSSVIIPVLLNDYDPNGDLLTIIGMTSPQNGDVRIHSNKKDIIYTPFSSITGAASDAFQYTISDGQHQETDQASVNIQISDFFICSDTPIPISQASSEDVEAIIFVPPSTAVIEDLNVLLSIDHPYMKNLTASLRSPDQRRIILFEYIGEKQDRMTNIVFNDEALRTINNDHIPLTGSYKPLEPLSSFDSGTFSGEWHLIINDMNKKGNGTLVSFELQIFYFGDPPLLQSSLNKIGTFQQIFRPFHDIDHQCVNAIQIETAIKPFIQIKEIPHIGNRIKPIKGNVHNALSNSTVLMIYIYTDVWHLKPGIESPFTQIMEDGSWQCDITTQYGDEKALKIAIFLFSKTKKPMVIERLPVLPNVFFQKAISYEIIEPRALASGNHDKKNNIKQTDRKDTNER